MLLGAHDWIVIHSKITDLEEHGFPVKKNPEISNIVAQNLTSTRACVKKSVENWYTRVYSYLKQSNSEDILQEPYRVFNAIQRTIRYWQERVTRPFSNKLIRMRKNALLFLSPQMLHMNVFLENKHLVFLTNEVLGDR